jgi:heat shock protein HslJ
MGFCVAGGGYLPVLCDTLLMTEGSGLYLAGQALVKAAIGQEVSDEDLGGATMHAEISGTIDFKEPDDESCLVRLREVLGKRAADPRARASRPCTSPPRSELNTRAGRPCHGGARPGSRPSAGRDISSIFTDKQGEQYDIKDSRLRRRRPHHPQHRGTRIARPDFDEYKADYGRSIVTGYARIGGHAVGIVANQVKITQQAEPGGRAGPGVSQNMPRVIYDEAADKSARFIMDCNQRKIPLVFIHDTTGFMVGRDSEQAGIIRSGAKMVNAMSNCVVPKIVLITGVELRRGELRHVRPRVRALPQPRLAGQQVRRHGRRPGDGRARDDRGAQPPAQGRGDRPRDPRPDPRSRPRVVQRAAGHPPRGRTGVGGPPDRPSENPRRTHRGPRVGPAGVGLFAGVQDGCAAGPTISLTPEGGVSGQSGVNRYVTSIESEQHAVNACRFDAIATSRMAGPPDAMAFEQRFLALLGQVRKLAVESDALRFESTEGDELLRFAPAADTSANE